MSNIFGLVLIIASVYILGQNIIFTNHYHWWWQRTAATGSVIALMAGVGSLTFWRQQMGNAGWIFIGIGIVLVFLSSSVILNPTSLWTFCVAMLLFASGYQLLTRGRIKF